MLLYGDIRRLHRCRHCATPRTPNQVIAPFVAIQPDSANTLNLTLIRYGPCHNVDIGLIGAGSP